MYRSKHVPGFQIKRMEYFDNRNSTPVTCECVHISTRLNLLTFCFCCCLFVLSLHTLFYVCFDSLHSQHKYLARSPKLCGLYSPPQPLTNKPCKKNHLTSRKTTTSHTKLEYKKKTFSIFHSSPIYSITAFHNKSHRGEVFFCVCMFRQNANVSL